MGKQGLKGTQGNQFLYQELDSGISSAIGLDSADGKVKISVSGTPDADPAGLAQLAVDSVADKVELPQETTANGGIVQANPTGVLTSHPLSAFSADITAPIPNITGDGTLYEIIFNRTYTNIGGDFDTVNGVYIAPVNGMYQFSTTVSVDQINDPVYSVGLMNFEVKGTGPSVGLWSFSRINAFAIADSTTDDWRQNGSLTVELAAGDTVNVEVAVGVGPKTINLNIGSGGPPSRTWFSGSKLFDL